MNLETEVKMGQDPTPDTIRSGEVRMKEHPLYTDTISEIEQAGFEVRETGNAKVTLRKVVGLHGEAIPVEKFVEVKSDMRFLDLEHELGHLNQLTERFADNPPPN